MFKVGGEYTRSNIQDLLGVPESERKGNWSTGYHKHDGEWFVFVGVGIPGRTGHNYMNEWIGDQLRWRGKGPSQLGQPVIDEMVGGKVPVRVFWRTSDRAPFIYQGLARAAKTQDTKPVTVLWSFDVDDQPSLEKLPEEISGATFTEGAAKKITVNAYERNPAARLACLASHGYSCCVCGFDFEATYGELGHGYIHVHHLRALAEIKEGYVVDPIEDLRPVCPNCHAMIHRGAKPLSPEALKALIQG